MNLIDFGNIEWQVIDIEKGLVISKNILFLKEFDEKTEENESGSNIYENSTLKKYLEEKWIYRFTKEEEKFIKEIKIPSEEEMNLINEIDRIKTYNNKKWFYWLYTPHISYSCTVKYIDCDGLISYHYACLNSLGIVPALILNIDKETLESMIIMKKLLS